LIIALATYEKFKLVLVDNHSRNEILAEQLMIFRRTPGVRNITGCLRG